MQNFFDFVKTLSPTQASLQTEISKQQINRFQMMVRAEYLPPKMLMFINICKLFNLDINCFYSYNYHKSLKTLKKDSELSTDKIANKLSTEPINIKNLLNKHSPSIAYFIILYKYYIQQLNSKNYAENFTKRPVS